MKRVIRLILITALLITSMQVPVTAANLQDSLVPQDRDTDYIGEVELEYNKYPVHRYELDTYVDTSGDWLPWNWADGAGKQIYIALMEITQAIWGLNVLLAHFTMKIVQESFQLDFVSNVVDEIGAAIQNIAGFNSNGFMANGLWPLMITFILSLVGAWAAYVGMIKRESSRAWGGLISALIIFVFSLGFFSNAERILGGINDWSSDLQSKILATSASIVNPGASYTSDEGIATIRNQMFDLMVKRPYLLMQYGTTQVDEDRVNQMLELDPILKAEEREQKAKEEVEMQDNSMMSIDGVTQRAGFVPLLFVANTIIGLFLLMVSGSIILFQIIFLALALFSPVPLLMAIVPRWQQTAVDWLMKIIHAQLMKIGIALLLTILFGISAILYRATESSDLGFLGMMLLQIICFVGVWAKRKDLFDMVSTAANNIQSSTGKTLQNYKSHFNNARNKWRQGRTFLNSGKRRFNNQDLANRPIGGKQKARHESVQKLANRNSQLGGRKARLSPVATENLLDRRNQEEQKDYKKQMHHRANIENAPTGKEQLVERSNENNDSTQPAEKVTSIDELRKRQLKSGKLTNAPLVERNLKDVQRETAVSRELPESKNVELEDRKQAERNVNLRNQQILQDNINEEQESKLAERRTLQNNKEKNVSQVTVNRNVVNHEGKERNIQENVNRNQISNESNTKTINNITERKNNVSENNRNIQENVINRESVTKNVTHRNEQDVNVNREQVNVSRIIENAKRNDKPLTKWEVEQQLKAKKK